MFVEICGVDASFHIASTFLMFFNCFLHIYPCRYYIEVLHQEWGGAASIDVGLYKEKSTFTAQQSDDAVNEIQVINASYDVLNEIQVSHRINKLIVFYSLIFISSTFILFGETNIEL